MSPTALRTLYKVSALSVCVILSACQSLPKDIGRSTHRLVPGELSQSRHAHVFNAIDTFESLLSASPVRFDALRWDPHLIEHRQSLASASQAHTDTRAIRLAATQLLNAGPYRFVSADSANGRLEYRSGDGTQWVSVWVRKPDNSERDSGATFVVNDIYGQVALSELMQQSEQNQTVQSGIQKTNLRPVAIMTQQIGVGGDAAVLAHFDSLPIQERSRQDLLALRALLNLRQNKDRQASRLIEQGLIRYPDSPMFNNLAVVLFERASKESEPPKVLINRLQQLPEGRVRQNRLAIRGFLGSDSEGDV